MLSGSLRADQISRIGDHGGEIVLRGAAEIFVVLVLARVAQISCPFAAGLGAGGHGAVADADWERCFRAAGVVGGGDDVSALNAAFPQRRNNVRQDALGLRQSSGRPDGSRICTTPNRWPRTARQSPVCCCAAPRVICVSDTPTGTSSASSRSLRMIGWLVR